MNARQKRDMIKHYETLGWSYNQIIDFGTQDLTGELPSHEQVVLTKKLSAGKKSEAKKVSDKE
tara:strand:+ start:9332 stop:9520 length:189 start_codon:yes stop_codon:yes gene_type:complete